MTTYDPEDQAGRRLMGFSTGRPSKSSTVLPARYVAGGSSCPLWVKSRHRIGARRCPLYPRKRTSELAPFGWRNSSDSLAMFTAILRASSRVSSLG